MSISLVSPAASLPPQAPLCSMKWLVLHKGAPKATEPAAGECSKCRSLRTQIRVVSNGCLTIPGIEVLFGVNLEVREACQGQGCVCVAVTLSTADSVGSTVYLIQAPGTVYVASVAAELSRIGRVLRGTIQNLTKGVERVQRACVGN